MHVLIDPLSPTASFGKSVHDIFLLGNIGVDMSAHGFLPLECIGGSCVCGFLLLGNIGGDVPIVTSCCSMYNGDVSMDSSCV